MTIFDYLNDLLFTKRGQPPDNIDEESNFNMYMTNRWISMYSSNLAIIINSTTNWLGGIFNTKSEYYKFVKCIIPRVNRKRIHYIKKKKPDTPEEEVDNIQLIAKRLELSQREIKSYYELRNNCTKRTG